MLRPPYYALRSERLRVAKFDGKERQEEQRSYEKLQIREPIVKDGGSE